MKIKILFALSISLAFLLFSSCKEEDEQITITVKSSNPECSVAGSGTYYKGSEISIAAIPGDGFRFVRWDDGNINNPRRIIVEFSTIYVAMFETTGSGGGGTTVPNAPTGVSVTNEGNAANPSIKISWNSVSNATSYKVYRSSSSTGSYSQLGSGTSSTYAYDNNPMSGYNYYKVKAVNSAGESSFSSYGYYNNSGGGTTVPNAPTGVTVTNEGNAANPSIKISWNSVSNATSYKVYRSSSSTGSYSQLGSGTSSTYAYDNNPMSGYNYYKVKAVNSAGESSFSSYGYYNNNGGGGGTTVPNAPTGVTVTNEGNAAIPSIKISWNSVSNATSYKVYRSSSSTGSYSQLGSGTSSTYAYDNNPMSGYNYYKVKAVNSAGESSFSSYDYYNNDGGASKYSPCPPTVSVNGTSSQSVSWTSSTSSGCGTPTSFEVYKYDPSSGKWELKTTTTSHSYSVPSSAVHPGINRYAVKAINSAGSATNYGYSSEISLSKPSSFSAQKQGSDYVKFTWSAVSKATGYQIFVSTSSSGTYSILKQIDDGSTTTTTVYYPGASGTTYYFKIKAVYSCDLFIVYSDLTTYKSVKF